MTKGVFVGLSTIDLVYEVHEFPVINSKITAKSQSVFVGGPATNAAIAFRHLGGNATLVAAVGRHPIAGMIHEELSRYSIPQIDLNPNFDGVPAISAVAVNDAGQRNVISTNASRMSLPPVQVNSAALAAASIVLVDGHSMPACLAWADAARRNGIRVVLDGGSWKEGMETLLGAVDTVICSADFRVPGCSDTTQVANFLKSRGIPNIAITAGSGPIMWATQDQSGLVSVPQVAVVDTMGAGDILHGAFCWYAAQGSSFPEALERAAEIASESCRFAGTRAWMQSNSPRH